MLQSTLENSLQPGPVEHQSSDFLCLSLSHSMEVDDGPSSDTEDLLSFVRMLDLLGRVVRPANPRLPNMIFVSCARLTESLRPAARHAIE